MKTVGITHVGKVRQTNEDTVMIECEDKPHYFLVADGMGGHAAGEVASKTAAACIKRFIEKLRTEVLTEEQILDAITYANTCLLADMERNEHLQGMGTTLTFAYTAGDSLIIAQVGDSGAFLFNGESLHKVTKDHTYVQHLIDSGVIKPNAAGDYPFKNIITRALGMKKLEVDFYQLEWKEGDLLLLCSDGLTAYVDEDMMRNVLADSNHIRQKAQFFVDFALESGGKDNISVVIAKNEPWEEGAE